MTELTAEELAAQIEQQKLEEHKNEVRISHPPLPPSVLVRTPTRNLRRVGLV
jgi:hypothetical protein